jgi:hypothetical protein
MAMPLLSRQASISVTQKDEIQGSGIPFLGFMSIPLP